MNADVTKVKPGREPARAFLFGFVSGFVVHLKAIFEEFTPTSIRCEVPTLLVHHWRDGVVNGQCGKGITADVAAFAHTPEEFVGRHGRVRGLENFGHSIVCQHWQAFGALQRFGMRELMHVLGDGFVQVASKGVGRLEVAALCTHGHEAVGIDGMNFAGFDGEGRVQHVEGVVGGEIIDDASLGPL